MKKKIVSLLLVLFILTLIITPVLAGPENGQKEPIAIYFSNEAVTPDYPRTKIVGNVMFLYATLTYDITIDIVGTSTSYTGTVDVMREVLMVLKEGGSYALVKDDNVFNIDGQDGTFVGQSVLRIKDFMTINELGKTHALLKGTEVFEGQTINAGHDWAPSEDVTWTGYWLKR